MSEIESQIEKLIEIAIQEDIGHGDITTQACIPSHVTASGKLILKQAGIVAGLPFFKKLFLKVDPKIDVEFLVKEGSYQTSGAILAQVSGPASSILAGERVALNLIQHASGIATITSAFVEKVSGLKCAIMDTRKTLPGLRAVEKYAVRMGGGFNYRNNLHDRCLIKLNHLAYFNSTSTEPILEVVKRVRHQNPENSVEIEVETLEQLGQALQTDVTIIILRGMTPQKVRVCVEKIHKAGKKAYLESSGSITLNTIRYYAETDIDAILIGDITHSVPALNMKFKLFPSSHVKN